MLQQLFIGAANFVASGKRGGRGDDLYDFYNSVNLLMGIMLLLYGLKGAIRAWRACLKCRILMRAFGFFALKDRQLEWDKKSKEEKAAATKNSGSFSSSAGDLNKMAETIRPSGYGATGTTTTAMNSNNSTRRRGSTTPPEDQITQQQKSVNTTSGRESSFLRPRLSQTGPPTAEEKGQCLRSILSYGELHVSEMMADLEEAPSHIWRGFWLSACVLFVLVRWQDMNYLSRELLDLSAGSAFGAVFLPSVVLFRYLLDVFRGFLLVSGLLFAVFIPRARRKDYWVYDLPEDITDEEIDILLKSRNVGWISADIWHGWAAGIAVANGGISIICWIFDLWARATIGLEPYGWIEKRREALNLTGAPVTTASLPDGQMTPFQQYNPATQCAGKAWKSDFSQFMKCAPYMPGERLYYLFLAVRGVLCGMFVWAVVTTNAKFMRVEIGQTRFYRGLRAEVAIIKIIAWESAFVAVGAWYVPQGLYDYLNWGGMAPLQILLILFTAWYTVYMGYFCTWCLLDLFVDFEYTDRRLAQKFDQSWVPHEKELAEALRAVHETRTVHPERGQALTDLLELPPDELEVNQVLLYKNRPSTMPAHVFRTSNYANLTAGGSSPNDTMQPPLPGDGTTDGAAVVRVSSHKANRNRSVASTAAGPPGSVPSFGGIDSRTKRRMHKENPWLDAPLMHALTRGGIDGYSASEEET
ncbi:unnamed protein product [Amoebophrya sp. A120]|nr:unnamed protein product [Amoebophrya sp. A120]|eukprot:GSA120T00002738001.1